jgi:hypothetical protein
MSSASGNAVSRSMVGPALFSIVLICPHMPTHRRGCFRRSDAEYRIPLGLPESQPSMMRQGFAPGGPSPLRSRTQGPVRGSSHGPPALMMEQLRGDLRLELRPSRERLRAAVVAVRGRDDRDEVIRARSREEVKDVVAVVRLRHVEERERTRG